VKRVFCFYVLPKVPHLPIHAKSNVSRFIVSKSKNEEKRWEEFKQEFKKAIEKDKARTKQERRAWLDTLPEHVPPPTGDRVKVIFFEGNRRPRGKGKRAANGYSPAIMGILQRSLYRN
jgi:hypothetical protein